MPEGSRKQSDDLPATHEGSAIQQITQCVTDGHLKLADGSSVPVFIKACDKHRDVPTHHNIPVSEGFIGEKANVLQDTGCSSAAIRSSLVSYTQLTGGAHLCVLIDGTGWKFLIARVSIQHYTTRERWKQCALVCCQSSSYK